MVHGDAGIEAFVWVRLAVMKESNRYSAVCAMPDRIHSGCQLPVTTNRTGPLSCVGGALRDRGRSRGAARHLRVMSWDVKKDERLSRTALAPRLRIRYRYECSSLSAPNFQPWFQIPGEQADEAGSRLLGRVCSGRVAG